MMQTREEKIKSFKEKKELDARVKELHDKMKQDHVDEDVKVSCLLKLDKFCSKNLQKLLTFNCSWLCYSIQLNIELLLQREYFIGLLKQWIGNAKESLDSLQGRSYYVIFVYFLKADMNS